MRSTGSISRGKTAEKHNTRECYRDAEHTPGNIDRSRTSENVTLVNRSLEDVYRERFGDALEAYNAKQVEKGHPERRISDYLEKVREDKKLQPMYEFVVQVGNMDAHPDAAAARAIYEDWLKGFMGKYGAQFAVKQAIVHLDEAVPHMHVEVVPCAESGRGLGVQNSMNKAVRQAGFADYKAMLAGWDEVLTEAMARHGIERVAGQKDKQMGGVDIDTYKRSMAVRRETEKAEERLECLQQRADAEAGAVAELDRAIGLAELQPAAQTVAESARTLFKARNDGAREEVLAGEVSGLRSRISELEGANRAARDRVGELERDIERLGMGIRDAGARRDRARARVVRLIERLGWVPDTLSELAQEIGERLGMRVMNAFDALAENARDAVEAVNAALSRSRGWEDRGRGPSL